MAELKDLVSELMSLNDENLVQRVINNHDVQWCLSELYDILAADVVEVVRCKDCKWHDSVDGPMRQCDITDDDDFCSYGERKDKQSET